MTHVLHRPARLTAAALAAGFLLVSVGLAVAPGTAHAASFSVTTTADVVDAAGSCLAATPATLPGADGLVSLREAVCAANRNPGADVISVPAGTYTLTGSSSEDFAGSGDLDVWDDPFGGVPVPNDGLTIVGAGAGATIIDAANADRHFDVLSFTPFTFTLSGMTLRNGDAGPGSGGAIQTGFGAATELFDLVIEDSSAADGGAIANIQGDLTIFGSVIRNNTATGAAGFGGGVHSVGVLRMQATTVSGNSAAGGGGLALESGGADVSTIEQSTISGNSSGSLGGGILLTDFHDGQTIVSDSTIIDNVAGVNGGALYVDGSAVGEIVLWSTTITGNSSTGIGGIVQTAGFATVEHSIVAGNSGGDIAGTWASEGNIVGVAGGSIVDGVDDNRAGTAGTPLDPQLRAPGLFGGTTQVRVPLPGSPAIDTGVDCGAVDQRGVARAIGAGCDVGAVELTAAPDTTIVSGPASASTTASASFTFAASAGTGPYSFECRLDGGAYSPCTTPTALSGLADGSHAYDVRAIDSLGATDAVAAQQLWTITTQLAASGPSSALGSLIGGAAVLLLGGAALMIARSRTRTA